MSHAWAICIGVQDASALAPLRLVSGVEIAVAGAEIWLRGRALEDAIAARLSALPARGRYEWIGSDQLRRLDHRIPSERLPTASWRPLSEWLRVELPVAALPGFLPATISFRLVRSADEREPDLLLTTLEEFNRFVLEAASVRLERLRFAASDDGRVLVHGTPLPPLPGKRFVLHQSIAVPAGFTWQPAISADVAARRLGVSGGALVLWSEDDHITRLHAEQLIPVTRSGVAATVEALADSL
jgi:hypothetical protein